MPSRRCFNPCCDGTDSSTSHTQRLVWEAGCFNPCCDGTDSSTPTTGHGRPTTHGGFNPCCDGTDSSTPQPTRGLRDGTVSILVVMERTHRRRHPVLNPTT